MHFDSFELVGFSEGGLETQLMVPQWRLALDVGRGRPELLRAEHLALTHCHMDHAGGLPYLLALRQLYRMRPPTVYVPDQSADALVAMVAAWDKLQRFDSSYTLVRTHPGERYPLGRDLALVPFRTYHPVPSNGYTVERTTHRLRDAYRGMPGHEIGRLKREGVAVTEPNVRALLSVTGDTLAEVLDKQPQILDSEVLVLECTFLDSRKPYQAVRAGGHVHLDDLLARADRFHNRTLVLSHFSQLHDDADIRARLQPLADALPEGTGLRALRTRSDGPDQAITRTGAEPESGPALPAVPQ